MQKAVDWQEWISTADPKCVISWKESYAENNQRDIIHFVFLNGNQTFNILNSCNVCKNIYLMHNIAHTLNQVISISFVFQKYALNYKIFFQENQVKTFMENMTSKPVEFSLRGINKWPDKWQEFIEIMVNTLVRFIHS